tara:strand:+ start:3335 stop:3964 length:630 start_codon:yes stop_codon:yes gene_type:complete
MPVFQEIQLDSNTKLILWKIEETEQELIHLLDLPPSEMQKLENRKTPNHRLEFLATRASLSSLGVSINNLHFKESGAPYLDTQKHCSLSHTQNYAAAIVSQKQVGIDLETHRGKIVKIAPKFVHKKEMFALHNENQIFSLTRLWTAKEAVYKAFGMAGIHFSTQIEVHSFSMIDKKGFATLTHLEKEYSFTLHFQSINNGQLCMAILNS